VLEGARLGRAEVHAGETLEVEATLHPYQAEERVVRLAVKLPDSLEPGPIAGGGERRRDAGPADDAGCRGAGGCGATPDCAGRRGGAE